jgi:serine protease Do
MMRNKRLTIVFWSIIMMSFWIFSSYGLALTPKQIYQGVSPGVVLLFASEGSGSGTGSAGTGSIISEDGLVITNAHILVRKDSSPMSNIFVFLKPERVTGNTQKDLTRRYKGKIVAYDVPLDLALVKIENVDEPLAHAQQSDYAGVPGKNLFQTEASINRGNSGGPLLDEQGEMIGINSLIARKAKDGLAITAVNFAIKSNVALKWLNRMGYRLASAEAIPSQIPEEPARPAIEEQPKQEPVQPDKEVQSSEPKSGKERKEGEILTEKKPYKMDELIAGIQEMEDMMDEMRETIEKFRKRRR